MLLCVLLNCVYNSQYNEFKKNLQSNAKFGQMAIFLQTFNIHLAVFS